MIVNNNKRGKSKCGFEYLQWDSDFFDRDCYKIEIDVNVPFDIDLLQELKEDFAVGFEKSLVSLKVDADLVRVDFGQFQELGLRLIDYELKLSHLQRASKLSVSDDVKVIQCEQNILLPYHQLAKSIRYSRFHEDPMILKAKATELWISYLKNFKPSKTKKIFVAYCENNIAGVILVTLEGKSAILSVVSVVEEYQSKGIGSAMLSFVAKELKDYDISTEVYAKNKGALNFYFRNGLNKIDKMYYVFHRWEDR